VASANDSGAKHTLPYKSLKQQLSKGKPKKFQTVSLQGKNVLRQLGAGAVLTLADPNHLWYKLNVNLCV
jgi:hypothetical protein